MSNDATHFGGNLAKFCKNVRPSSLGESVCLESGYSNVFRIVGKFSPDHLAYQSYSKR